MKRTAMKVIKHIMILISVLVIGIIAGGCLLIGVYCLPVSAMRVNVEKDFSLFGTDMVVRLYENYTATQPDNYTDAIMLSNAIYESGEETESVVTQSIMVYRHAVEGMDPCENLVSYFEKDFRYQKEAYHWYWHGYLIFLKPLLLLLSYQNIRILNGCLLTAGVLWILYLMKKRNIIRYVIAFSGAVLALYPMVIPMSLQFATMCYICIVSVILLLGSKEVQKKVIFLFLIQGMATAYFDLLTYPLLALGMTLAFLCLLREEEKAEKSILAEGIAGCVHWGIGYAGMWIGKWVWGTILLRQNLFTKAIEKLRERTGYVEDADRFTIWDVYRRNFSVFVNGPAVILFILAVAGCFFLGYMGKESILSEKRRGIISLLLVGMMPLMWYVFAANHSYIHFWFTFRIISVSVFAGLCLVVKTGTYGKIKMKK